MAIIDFLVIGIEEGSGAEICFDLICQRSVIFMNANIYINQL